MSFTYKNKKGTDFYLRAINAIGFSSPERDIDYLSVQGRDGDLIMDNGRYQSVLIRIPVEMNPPAHVNVEELASRIANWLLTDINYHDFIWEHDIDFVYKALFNESFATERLLSNLGRTVLNFRFHPLKYRKESLVETVVVNNSVINNPFEIAAKPLLKITGNGNINLTIANSTPLVLQGVDGGIIIDSETQTVTSLDGERTQFAKMYSYPFPEIKPGNNLVTFTGATSVTIIKRLGALI